MKFEYEGYTLTIEEIRDINDNFVKYVSCCNQLDHFDIWKANDLNIIVVRFKHLVDREEKKVDTSITSINEGVAYQVKIKDKEYIIDVINNKLYRVV